MICYYNLSVGVLKFNYAIDMANVYCLKNAIGNEVCLLALAVELFFLTKTAGHICEPAV